QMFKARKAAFENHSASSICLP
ncbi:hypothetical protein CP8484711_0111B, partial [Chlamydia psittaci 84-8471/1]